jgi:tetratricopeptide (TPR) repeat protein
MEFLQYAYLQTGQDTKAAAISVEAASIPKIDVGPGFRRYWALLESRFPARQNLETGNWSAALKLRPAPGADVPAEQVIAWAHAVAAGHLRDRKAAERALSDYRATLNAADLKAMTTRPNPQWAETEAWNLFADARTDAAVALLEPVANVQDTRGKGEVDLPAREMLADMLRLSGRPDDALREYRLSLHADPGRFTTLLHAGEMAEQLGKTREASTYYRLLIRNTPHASSPASQTMAHAKVFLGTSPGAPERGMLPP